MIPIHMRKYSFALCFLIGMVLMAILVFVRRKRYAMPVWKVLVFTLLLSVTGVAGVRLLAILENFKALIQGDIAGGMSFFGAVLLIPILMPVLAKPLGLGFAQTNDLCAPCIAGMVGCERINCFLSGCCGGRPLHLGTLEFTPRTQIIESVLDFLLMAFLMVWFRRDKEGKQEGTGYPLFLIGYCGYRFILEFLRDTDKFLRVFSRGQVYCLIGLAAAGWYLYNRKKKNAAIATENAAG